jgi:hypothetical protein
MVTKPAGHSKENDDQQLDQDLFQWRHQQLSLSTSIDFLAVSQVLRLAGTFTKDKRQ